jgi:hypothetical protein
MNIISIKPFRLFMLWILSCGSFLSANECCGKIELSPAYVHIDVLESNKTVHRMDLGAIKGDINWKFWGPLLIKPTILYGKGSDKDEAVQAGFGLGACIPFKEKWYFTPTIGVNWGWIKTGLEVEIPVPIPNPPPSAPPFIMMPFKLTEKFRSISPYILFEASYTIVKGWRIVGNIQYSYSRTHTIIKPFVHDKSHSQGFSYSAMIEHDLTQKISINAGAGYNLSLTKEKHGMRIWGIKLGIAYWF